MIWPDRELFGRLSESGSLDQQIPLDRLSRSLAREPRMAPAPTPRFVPPVARPRRAPSFPADVTLTRPRLVGPLDATPPGPPGRGCCPARATAPVSRGAASSRNHATGDLPRGRHDTRASSTTTPFHNANICSTLVGWTGNPSSTPRTSGGASSTATTSPTASHRSRSRCVSGGSTAGRANSTAGPRNGPAPTCASCAASSLAAGSGRSGYEPPTSDGGRSKNPDSEASSSSKRTVAPRSPSSSGLSPPINEIPLTRSLLCASILALRIGALRPCLTSPNLRRLRPRTNLRLASNRLRGMVWGSPL
jgi:hypothetical protein